jgi:small subunit ribosomal protein S6
MRHYEIVFLVHPDQSTQVPDMIERYRNMITGNRGAVHRFEDWGRRATAYTINKNVHKAHYLMMNIECDQAAFDELMTSFRFNDAVLRNLVIRRDEAISAPSAMMQREERKRSRGPRPDRRPSERPQESAEKAPETQKIEEEK